MRQFALVCLLCATMSEACRNAKVTVPTNNSGNITCVTLLEESITCYWDLLSNSTSKLYSVRWISSRKINTKTTTDNCYSFFPALGSAVTVSVTTNSSNETWEVTYDNPYSTVKYGPPIDVWTEANSDSIRVNWKNDKIITNVLTDILCEVQVLQEAPHIKREWKTIEHFKVHSNTMATTINIIHVKPCFNYTASVRCAFEEGSPWSEWRSNTTFLPLSVDSIVLHVWRRVLEVGKEGRRKVDLMWKGPPLICHAIDGYRIFVDSNFTKHSAPYENYFQLPATHNTQEVVITAYKNGTMLCNDSVTIPGVAEELGGPPVKPVWMTNVDGQILVSWKAPLRPVSSYMVVYYTNRSVSTWLQTQETNLSFPGVPKTLHTVVVTPLYGDIPGNDSTLYMYTEEGDPAKVTGVKVTDVDDTWAIVEWDAVSPDQCCGFVRNYTVFCMVTGKKQPELNVTVNGTDKPGKRNSVKLTKLQPSTAYSVHVMASSITGSSKSSSASFKTKQFGEGIIIMVILTALGALLLMIIPLSIYILLRKIKFHEVPNPGLSSVGQWTRQDSKEISSPWGISQLRYWNMACDTSTLEDILPLRFDNRETQLSSPQVCTEMTGGSTRAADLQTPTDMPAKRGQTSTGFRDMAMPRRHSTEPALEQVLNYISVETGQTLACAVGNQGSLPKTKTVNSKGQSAGLMDMTMPRRHSDEPSLEQVLNYISVETGQTLACSVVNQGSLPETKSAKLKPGEESTLTTNLSYMTVVECRQPKQINL